MVNQPGPTIGGEGTQVFVPGFSQGPGQITINLIAFQNGTTCK